MERFAYFVGCYWGIDVTATVMRFVCSGDIFIDVGANLGFVTLTASKNVGHAGRVIAFEPLADMAARLRETLRLNRIDNVTVHEFALGDVETAGVLAPDTHPSKANLRDGGAGGALIRIVRGDDVIKDIPDHKYVFVKLDVEGYELRVLEGFQSLLRRPQTGFLIEITDRWLRDVGGSADELFGLMHGKGFSAYIPKLTALSRYQLQAIAGPLSNRIHYDVVFLRLEDRWLTRS